MRKLLIVAGLCAAGLAWARPPEQLDKSIETGQNNRSAGEFGTGAALGDESGQMGQEDAEDAVETGINQQGRTADTSMRTDVEGTSQEHPKLTLADSYEVEGKVQSVEPDEHKLVVSRQAENLPPLELTVVEGSQIQRDGAKANLEDFQPGDEVRANFNVAMDEPIAIKVEGKKEKK